MNLTKLQLYFTVDQYFQVKRNWKMIDQHYYGQGPNFSKYGCEETLQDSIC